MGRHFAVRQERGTARAATTTAMGGDVQGGSSITQQYVKNVLVITEPSTGCQTAGVAAFGASQDERDATFKRGRTLTSAARACRSRSAPAASSR
ncbi:hypothetical protein C5C18_10815 [Rathayibacter tritici]|nr:hypothetical protein C5C21_09405 [Rathayibacter tritici]PPG06356.1 hypothetical protein C5C18_10815 [Rathayibacter tritici]